MPKFSINDKVSFINEKQDGIIKSFRANGICLVEIEDGFTIEALETELVLIRSSIKTSTPPNEEVKKAELQKALHLIENFPALQNGIYIISCPAVSGLTSTGPADIYLVNKTEYQLLFACSWLSGKKLNGILSGITPSNTQLFLTTLKREEALDKGDLYIQFIFHKEGAFEKQPTQTKEMQLMFPEVSSALPGLPAPYAFCRIMPVWHQQDLSEVNTDALLSHFSGKDLPSDSSDSKNKPKSTGTRSASFKSAHEIDLHIEEITSDFSGLSNSEIIKLQLDLFHRKLNEALVSNAGKIIFIHGNGNGILKSSIRKELTAHGFHFNDASYERYGGGATEVVL